MKILYDKRAIIATTDDERDLLSVLFNQQLLRGAYEFWSDKNNPNHACNVHFILEHKPKAYVILSELEDPDGAQERAKEKIEKEIAEIDEQKQKDIDNIFGFLNEKDTN